MFRRILAAICIVCMLLCLAACKKTEDSAKKDNTPETTLSTTQTQPEETGSTRPENEKPAEPEDKDALTLAQEAISLGDYETAYRYLYECEDKTDEIKALMSHFVFVPLKSSTSIPGGEEFSYTYDENGYIVKYAYSISVDYAMSTTGVYTHDKKGNVLTEHITNEELGLVTEEETTYTYDQEGNRITQVSPDGSWTYTYDENGNMITSSYSNAFGYWSNTTNTYDEQGRLIKTRNETSDETWAERNCIYDENGYLQTDNQNTSYGSWKNISYIYDAVEKTLVCEEYADNHFWYKNYYTYDANGVLISKYTEDSRMVGDEVFWYSEDYAYDSFGRLVEIFSQEYNGPTNSTVYTYDAEGKLREKESFPCTEYYTYDDWGNIVSVAYRYPETAEYEGLGSVRSYSYELFYYPDGVPEQIQDLVEAYIPADLYH